MIEAIEKATLEDLRADCMHHPRTQDAVEAAAELTRRIGPNDWSEFVDRMHKGAAGKERLLHVLNYLEYMQYEKEYGREPLETRWYGPAVQLVRDIYWAKGETECR